MARDLAALRVVAAHQFGRGAGVALFPHDSHHEIRWSSGGRPRQVHSEGRRVVSYGTDGRFTLGLAGGDRLRRAFDPPTGRVAVGAESDPYVREGRNVFAKFVDYVDGDVRPGDEVVVVRADDDLLGVGRAELAAEAMRDFETGMAVSVREGQT